MGRTRLQRGRDPSDPPELTSVAASLVGAIKLQQRRAQMGKNPLSISSGAPAVTTGCSLLLLAGSELQQDPGAGSASLCSLSPSGSGGVSGTPLAPRRDGATAALRGDELLCRRSDVLQLLLFMEQNDSHGTTPDFLSI